MGSRVGYRWLAGARPRQAARGFGSGVGAVLQKLFGCSAWQAVLCYAVWEAGRRPVAQVSHVLSTQKPRHGIERVPGRRKWPIAGMPGQAPMWPA